MKDTWKGKTILGSVALLALGVAVSGCSGSSSGGGPPPLPASASAPVTSEETTEVLKTSTSVGTTAVLPFQTVLGEVSPGSFPATTTSNGSISTTVTGDASAGTLVSDFTGTLTGRISANYNSNGSAGSILVSFQDFGVQTSTVTFRINGNLNVNYSYSGSNATGTVTGTLRLQINTVTIDVAVNLTVDYDGAQNRFVFSGTTTVTHSVYGIWSATFAGVEYDGGAAEITTGTITLVETSPAATATYVFTGASSGTFSVTPAGISGNFQL